MKSDQNRRAKQFRRVLGQGFGNPDGPCETRVVAVRPGEPLPEGAVWTDEPEHDWQTDGGLANATDS